MLIWNAEAAARLGMPAAAVAATALVAVSAHKRGTDPRTDAQGAPTPGSPPV